VWAHPLTIAIVAGLVAGLASTLLTIFLTPWLRHHFWKRQRADELRLAAISEYNRLTNAYVAACISQTGPQPPVEDWLRDLNTTAATIRVLFSESAFRAAKEINKKIKPYAAWAALPVPERIKLGDEFSDVCHVALTALYREVVGPR
jgi:hypothetical protein